MNENKTSSKIKRRKKKKSTYFTRHEKKAQQINNKLENFLLAMKYKRILYNSEKKSYERNTN